MSLYEYTCKKCGHCFKKLFLIVGDTPFICPTCGDKKAKKLLNYISLLEDKEIGIYFETSPEWFSSARV